MTLKKDLEEEVETLRLIILLLILFFFLLPFVLALELTGKSIFEEEDYYY